MHPRHLAKARPTPESGDPTGVLISVHAGLCVSSVFPMFVIDSRKSKSKRLFSKSPQKPSWANST